MARMKGHLFLGETVLSFNEPFIIGKLRPLASPLPDRNPRTV